LGIKRNGQIIRDYQIVDQIWQGSTSAVYLARAVNYNPPYGIYVAVKILSSRRGATNYIRQFQREAAIGSGLDHPNIVKVYELINHSDTLYLLMEYVRGKSLRQWSLERTFSFCEICEIFRGMLSALSYLEQKRIIHKDIKPENILISEDLSQVKLTDFGYSVRDTFFRFDPFPYAGTQQYMAPERKTGKATARSDIYSLGKVIEELLMKLNEYPNFILSILKNCVAPDPSHRYMKAEVAKRDLDLLCDYYKKKHAIRDTV